MFYLFCLGYAVSPPRKEDEAKKILDYGKGKVEIGDIDTSGNPWERGQLHGMVHVSVEKSRPGDLPHVIDTYNNLCETVMRENSMHLCIGPPKTLILQETVRNAVEAVDATSDIHVLELGSFSGEGTLHLFRHLPPGSTVVSVDEHPHYIQEGTKLVRHAIRGQQATYHPMVLDDYAKLDDFLDNMSKNYDVPGFDVVRFNQKPENFYSNLETLRKKNMLKPNAKIIANNGNHSEDLQKFVTAITKGPFKTTFHDIRPPWSDKISVTTYDRKDEL